MKTISHLAAIVAMMFLCSLCMADDYGWSGSSSRPHSGSAYGRSAGHYGDGYGPSMSSRHCNYGSQSG
ncbi:MAG: hypothetical protein O2856_04700 [Planctomycetota bacterium]|nr:hypothetical protein [Planctomycetota bacterium]